jgi:hypothetical protein
MTFCSGSTLIHPVNKICHWVTTGEASWMVIRPESREARSASNVKNME